MQKRPNIIVFMTDQQNAQTIRPENPAITPNMDRFYRKFVVFDQAYCASPHCCPSRASFFSGLYPSQHGVWNNVEVDNGLSRGLYEDVTLFPQALKSSGYHTVFSGKWHVSAYEGPLDRGFDEVVHEQISNCGRFAPDNRPRCNNWQHVYNSPQNIYFAGGQKDFGQITREGYPVYYQFGSNNDPFGDSVSVEKACEVLRKHTDDEEPLFLYVGVTGPHDPYCPPQEYLDLYADVDIQLPKSFRDDMEDKPALYRRTRDRFELTEEEHIESIRRYLAFVSYEDALFGRLMDTLAETDFADNTYVLFLTDHGDYLGAHRLWAKGLPCFREAYQICAMIGGAPVRQHRVVEEFVSITDFAPTILELAGIVPGASIAGRSLCPFLRGQVPENWRSEIYTQTNGNELYGIQRAVWNKKWKYVFNGFDYDELYDLENDPDEMHNLINDAAKAAVVKDLCKKLWRFARETGDNCTSPYIMVSLAPYGPGIIWEDMPE